jgi:hypothetical protein
MSYLQPYVRQVKPRNESYIPPVDKIQTFLTEGDTKEATAMENVIVACWNNRSLKKKDDFAKKIVKDTDVQAWYEISKLAKGLDGKKLKENSKTKLSDTRVTDALWNFSKLLGKKAPSGVSGKMSGAGRSDPSTSAFWKYHTGKTKDTSKADIMIGAAGISVKGLQAVLMSGVAAETKATALAAFSRAAEKSTLTKLQKNIISAMDDMIGSSDRIDIEAPPEAEEINTRSMGRLTADDALKYGINVTGRPRNKDESLEDYKSRLKKKKINYETAKFTDDRWLTVSNMQTVVSSNRGDPVTDWTKVNYDDMPAIKVKDKKGKSVELTDDTKKKEIIDRVNTAAANAISQAKQAKISLERDLKTEFNDSKVREAFAWEAMSGWDKFNSGAGEEGNPPAPGQGGTGFANQMLAFDWGLGRMAWYAIESGGENVKKTAKQMAVKFDMKGGSYEAAGAKAGYSFSQTLRFGIKYVNDGADAASLTMEEKTHEAKQMLSEGLLNEWTFWEKLKKIWKSFVSTLKVYWEKFIDFLKKMKDKIVEIFDAGIYSVLNYFELDVTVKVNTKVKLL